MKKSDQRNLNPTAPALLAMWRWSEEYAAQRGGVMDFWDVQPEHRQRLCIEAVERVAEVLRPTVR